MPGLGRYLRLRASITAALSEVGDSALAAKALGDAYDRFRAEALSIANETQTADEFERLFPTLDSERRPMARAGFDPIRSSSASHEARALLSSLAGWLDGFVLEEDPTRGN